MTELNEEELKQKVLNFLQEFKALVTMQGMYLVPRGKNRQGLIDSGLTKKNFANEILILSLLDFSQGPKEDSRHPGEYWVFGKKYLGKEFYIKLKIAETPDGHREALCISFHRAEWPLNYPFRNQSTKSTTHS